MPQLVEDADGEFGAGHFNKLFGLRWNSTGSMVLAGRSVDWVWQRQGVEVTHELVQGSTQRVTYIVQTVDTVLPSGGYRPWWLCPDCGRRVDSLYLPVGRARLGCLRCGGLCYRSQTTAKRVKVRKPRPTTWIETHVEWWKRGSLSGDLSLVKSKKSLRNLLGLTQLPYPGACRWAWRGRLGRRRVRCPTWPRTS